MLGTELGLQPSGQRGFLALELLVGVVGPGGGAGQGAAVEGPGAVAQGGHLERAAAGHQHQDRDAVRPDDDGIERLAAVRYGKVAEQQRRTRAGVGAQRGH